MILLPKRLGSFTLTRKLGTGGVSETFLGTQDAGGERPVVVRYILPYIQRDPTRLAAIEARIRDLLGVRHPFLVHVFDHVVDGEDRYVVEEHIEGIPLDRVLQWCRQTHRYIPHNIFLNIATQICNGLEALHGRTGKGSSAEHVLHLGLKPGAIFLTREGKVVVGSYGLVRSPTALPHGGVAGPVPTRMDYLSPEQTHPDQKLTPASDIFALAAVLYEMITLESLFRADSNLQTIHRIRRSEVTTQLLRVKELMPGLDKILFRALSLNPHHRYRRAFVLREDLRGLMAGYSFSSIAEDTRSFLAPLLANQEDHAPSPASEPAPQRIPAPVMHAENTETTDIRGFQEALSSETLSPPAEVTHTEPTMEPTAGGMEKTEPDNTLVENAPPPARPPVYDADDELDDWVPEASGGVAVPPMPPPEPPTAWKLPRKKRKAEEDEARSVFSDVADPTATSFTQLPPPRAAAPKAKATIPPVAAEPVPSSVAAPPTPAVAAPTVAAAPPPPASVPKPAPAAAAPAAPAPAALRVVSTPKPASPAPAATPPEPAEPDTSSANSLLFGLIAGGVALAVVCGGGLILTQWGGTTKSPEAELAAAPAPVAAPAPAAPAAAVPPAAASLSPTPAPGADPVVAAAPVAAVAPAPVAAPVAAPAPVAAAPTPIAATPAPRPAPAPAAAAPRPAPAPTPVAATVGTPVRSPAPAAVRPSNAVVRPAAPTPVAAPAPSTATLSTVPSGSTFDRYVESARNGRLGVGDVTTLEEVTPDESAYSRSRAILLMNAQTKGDDNAARRYLDDLMAQPENQYNPVFLSDLARWYVNHGDYDRALTRAQTAERYWARLPSELVFAKKAEIYEVQAAAWQGRFYRAPEQLEYLDNAIRTWERYEAHVATRARSDLQTRARNEIARLQSLREKLQ